METTKLKTIIFISAIISGVILQILTYSVEPFSANGTFLQGLFSNLFYIPLLVILITFPRPESTKGQIITINILVICIVIATMNVDYQVLRIFSLPEWLAPESIGTYVWDKTYNLYWIAWMLQCGIVFVTFALIYRFKTNETWISIRIGMVGPLISLFSFEDILYYPMHGENPFNISSWSWLPQHNIYFGRPVNTVELIWIVSIAMISIFIFLIIFAIRGQSKAPPTESFSDSAEKRNFFWLIPLTLGAYFGFILLYLNTNIINDQIPFYTILAFLGIIILFILFTSYFPAIKSRFRQLIVIFGCFILFWIAATEMDWHAVEAGFHWLVPTDPRKPPGDFWVWCDYRMAMWLVFLPIIVLLISLIFKFIGNSRQSTLKLGITNFLILFLGIDSIVIFLVMGGSFPVHWNWSNIHYSILDGGFILPVLIGIAIGIGVLIIYIHKRKEK